MEVFIAIALFALTMLFFHWVLGKTAGPVDVFKESDPIFREAPAVPRHAQRKPPLEVADAWWDRLNDGH